MNIKRLDHFVLTVADIPTSLAFFQSVMGMNAIMSLNTL
ncbi:VOC family protein [Vibrio natriegens]